MKVLIFGAGYSGSRIGKKLASEGAQVFGTTRSRDRMEDLGKENIEPLYFDGGIFDEPVLQALSDATHLICGIAPPRQKIADHAHADPVLRALGNQELSTLAPKLQWVGYLSTVGVYGHHDGAWVDETTQMNPVSERSLQRVAAEDKWRAAAQTANLPLGIFRLSGIYGPGRNAFVAMENGKSRRLVKKDQVFNRIHVGDIAAALTLAAMKKASGVFNITDDEPAPPQDVVTFAHELAGKTPPPEIDFETADITPMARSFYGENKRVSNARSKKDLGLDYQFPNYREAFRHMWENDDWR